MSCPPPSTGSFAPLFCRGSFQTSLGSTFAPRLTYYLFQPFCLSVFWTFIYSFNSPPLREPPHLYSYLQTQLPLAASPRLLVPSRHRVPSMSLTHLSAARRIICLARRHEIITIMFLNLCASIDCQHLKQVPAPRLVGILHHDNVNPQVHRPEPP